MTSWVDPYHFIESIHTLRFESIQPFIEGMDQLKTSLTVHALHSQKKKSKKLSKISNIVISMTPSRPPIVQYRNLETSLKNSDIFYERPLMPHSQLSSDASLAKKWRFSRNFYVFRMIASLTNPFYIASERVGALKGFTRVISWIEWQKMAENFSLTSEFLQNFLDVSRLFKCTQNYNNL